MTRALWDPKCLGKVWDIINSHNSCGIVYFPARLGWETICASDSGRYYRLIAVNLFCTQPSLFCSKLLKGNHQASPRSTPNSSPRSTKSPPLPPSSRSAPPTPGGQLQPSNMMSSLGTGADSLAGVGGDVRSAFGSSTGLIGSSSTSLTGSTSNSAVTNSSGRSLRNDLLVAADSVTNAMSTLVRELNSEGSDQEEGEENIRKPLDFEAEDGESDGTGNTAALWREEIRKRYEQESQFMAELRSRNLGNGHDYDDKALRRHASGLPDGDGYKEVDESYVHGPDDDDTGGTNWEEAMKRLDAHCVRYRVLTHNGTKHDKTFSSLILPVFVKMEERDEEIALLLWEWLVMLHEEEQRDRSIWVHPMF
uniref:Uncharacterized protein n=1 Tax=Timema genevievae TaxID=629358 RepID=A0A7R9JPU2_TIMGE|nr:unnamed protein product [Timema genevievae]